MTFVFSTATQPALERRSKEAGKDPRWAPGRLTEIVPDAPGLFAVLKRVETEWREGAVGWALVARGMSDARGISQARQAVAIVDTRGHALALYRELERLGAGALHLSNNMCPKHRLERIGEIRERLRWANRAWLRRRSWWKRAWIWISRWCGGRWGRWTRLRRRRGVAIARAG